MTMTEEELVETKLEVCRKLLAKAESTTPEEAELLTAKAEQLMLRYAIDEAMLAAAMGKRSEEKVIERRITLTGVYRPSHAHLGHAVGQACGLRTIQNTWTPNQIQLYLIGFESDVARAELLITSLMIQAAPALRKFWKAQKVKTPWLSASEQLRVKRSFVIGFAETVADRLKTETTSVAKTVAAESPDPTLFSNSLAVALRDRKAAVDEWVDEHYGRLRTGRATRITASGYGEGRAAGRGADVGSPAMPAGRKALNRG